MFTKEARKQAAQKKIQEIHTAFDSAQERLLKQARTVLESLQNEQSNADSSLAERYNKVGFVNIPIVKEYQNSQKLNQERSDKIVRTKADAERIEYYQQQYPFLKFLTESELDSICNKYGLIYAPVHNYTEEVPTKNLKDIEMAQPLSNVDKPLCRYSVTYTVHNWMYNSDGYVTPFDCKLWKNPFVFETAKALSWKYDKYDFVQLLREEYKPTKQLHLDKCDISRIELSGLFIAAPPSHFNLSNLKKNRLGFFSITEVKDPVVFRYVNGGIQVLTKWGLEAKDEMLQMPILN